MSTHGGREMEIRRVTNALNNVGERADPVSVAEKVFNPGFDT